MSTLTPQQQQAIADLLTTMTLPSGLGSEESACSIAAINLALSGQLTDDIPACMSLVIGRWIIGVQDGMPADMRNSAEWKRLLPLAAGTGRDHEEERLQLILAWMWETTLPIVQPIADRDGFGAEWRTMLRDRTPAAAKAAAAAATTYAAVNVTDAAAAAATYSAYAAAYAATYADAADAARAALSAAAAARAATASVWQQLDPCGLLQRLITLRPA